MRIRRGAECDLYPVGPGAGRGGGRARAGAAPHRRAAAGAAASGSATLLEDEAETLDSAQRQRIEAALRSIQRRAVLRLAAWQAMLRAVAEPPPSRACGRSTSIRCGWSGAAAPTATPGCTGTGSTRRCRSRPPWPRPAHGLLITSATLRDTGEGGRRSGGGLGVGRGAGRRGAPALARAARVAWRARSTMPRRPAPSWSPMSGSSCERWPAPIGALFLAAGGGGLGLFTAIQRLQAVHARIAPALEAAGIPLLAQHVDAMDNATLVDVFRTELHSCLLGHRRDAGRGRRARPGAAAGRVRARAVAAARHPASRAPRPPLGRRPQGLRRQQGPAAACGRPSAGWSAPRQDRGVFVLLDRRTPTRLLSAFPAGRRGAPGRAGRGGGGDTRVPRAGAARAAVICPLPRFELGSAPCRRRKTLPMLARTGLDPQEALICTMVLVAAADGGDHRPRDRRDVRPGADPAGVPGVQQRAAGLPPPRRRSRCWARRTGLSHAGQMIRDALEPRLRETAYALACEVVAADGIGVAAGAADAGAGDGRAAARPAGRRGGRARHAGAASADRAPSPASRRAAQDEQRGTRSCVDAAPLKREEVGMARRSRTAARLVRR